MEMNNHIETYIPTDFNTGTLHPLKCLWIAKKYQHLVSAYFKEDLIADDVMRRAMHQVLSDLNLTRDEAVWAISVGTNIIDFLALEEMSSEELADYDICLHEDVFNAGI
jgi:hypothetical protein